MLRTLTLRTFITNFGILALGLVTSVVLSRSLGPTGRGEVAAVMLWPMVLVYLSSIGLFPATLYFTALPEANTKYIFANGFVLALLQSTIAIPLGYLVLPWLLSSQTQEVVAISRLFLIVIPISLITQLAMSILRGKLHILLFNWLRTIIPVGYLLGVIIFLGLEQLNPLNIIFLHLILNLLTLLAALLVMLKVGLPLGLKFEPKLAKRMLKYGFQVQVGDISQGANLSLDQMLMAALLSPTELGHYVVALSATNLSQVLSTAVKMVTTPSLAQSNSPVEQKALLELVFRKYWLLSIGVMLGLELVTPALIMLVYGVEFQASIGPAAVLLLAALFLNAKDVLEGGSQGLGLPWLSSQAELVALGVTVVLLLTLMPLIGIMGAALASLAAYATSLAVIVYGLWRACNISPLALFSIKLADLKELGKDLGGVARLARIYRN